MNKVTALSSSDKMTNEISALSLVESFLDEYYLFRRNVLSGKTEYFTLSKNEDETEEPVEEEPETGGEEEESSDSTWKVLTPEAFNSVVRHAKRLGVGGKKSPRQDIEEFVRSEEVPEFDPIREYLENLPEWDGKNHVAELFGRIPGLTSEQLGWCATWLRSAVAHWLQMDMFHGNETTPVLIGKQGCGKSTFAYRLLPDHLRQYFLDHINFANKFDSEMALTHNLFVNIDEFANMGPSQQGKLKQMLSKVKVNGRPIFGIRSATLRVAVDSSVCTFRQVNISTMVHPSFMTSFMHKLCMSFAIRRRLTGLPMPRWIVSRSAIFLSSR